MARRYLYPNDIPVADTYWAGGPRPTLLPIRIADPYGIWDDDHSTSCFHWFQDTSDAVERQLRASFDQLPPVFSISNVQLFVRLERDSSVYNGNEYRPFIYVTGNPYYIPGWAHADIGMNNIVLAWPLSPATGNPWTRAEVNGAGIGGIWARNLDGVLTNGIFVSAMTLIVDYIGAPLHRDSALDVGSRDSRRYSMPGRLITMNVPYDVGLDQGPNDVLPIAHFAGPDGTYPGWGELPWQMIQGLIESKEIHPDGYVSITCLDQRPYWCLYRDTAWPQAIAAQTGDGISRINKGNLRTYLRASAAWTQDGSSLLWMFAPNDQEMFGPDGAIFEGEGHNLIQYSGFQTGNITGWTKTGVGDHGSFADPEVAGAFAFGSAGLMWDPNTTGVTQCLLLRAGTAGWSTDLYVSSTATSSIGASTKVAVSYWFSNAVDGQSPQVALQRGIDSWYYNFASQDWHAAIQWQTLPIGSIGKVQRYDALVNVGAGATTLTAIVGLSVAGAVPEQESRFHCVQIDDLRHVFGTPILTVGASGDRALSTLTIGNGTVNVVEGDAVFVVSKRCVLAAFGALAFEVVPAWNSADLPAGTFKTVCFVSYDTNNFMQLYWDTDAARWVWRVVSGGVAHDATFTAPVTKGTLYRIAVRRVGAALELGSAQGRSSIFVNGVPGVDTTSVAPVETATSFWEIGTHSGVDPFDGVIRMQTSLQYVPTDVEMEILP